MPGLDSLTIKQMLGALKLYHADIAIEGPNVVGGPEPPQAGLEANLPAATAPDPRMAPLAAANARYAANPPAMQTSGERPFLSRVGAAYTGDSGADIAFGTLGGLTEGFKEGAKDAVLGTAQMLVRGPVGTATDFGLYQAPQLLQGAQDMHRRAGAPGGKAAMTEEALKWLNDPRHMSRVSGNILGNVAAFEAAGRLGAIAKDPEAVARIMNERGSIPLGPGGTPDTTLPADPLPELGKTYPRTAKALAKHGTPVQLQGGNRPLAFRFNRLVKDIYDRTLVMPGTSTYPMTGEVEAAATDVAPNTGTMMGTFSNQSGKTEAIPLSKFKPADIKRYLEKHADTFAKNKDRVLGTWIDTDPVTGQKTVYLDVTKKHESVRQAVVSAWTQKQPPVDPVTNQPVVRDPVTGQWPKPQKAGFNLETYDEPKVGNLHEFLQSDAFKQRLEEMYQRGVPLMNGQNWWQLHGTDLERVYGKENVKRLAGALAVTSPGTPPVHNMRSASEYMRRMLAGEPIVQPGFQIPATAVGSTEGAMGGVVPGDFNSPGTKMPMEEARVPNLKRVELGDYAKIQLDKANDMYHALIGEPVGVFDRHWAKLAEDWKTGVYAESTPNRLEGSMLPEADKLAGKKGQVNSYALVENAVRTAAKAKGLPLDHYSAYVWEGIRDTIKQTGELYGMEHRASAIPEASGGFPNLFNQMVAEKAKHMGMSVEKFEAGLRAGKYELLTAVLATPAGLAALHLWAQQQQEKTQKQ